MSGLSSDSVRNPCAMVVPNGVFRFGTLRIDMNPLMIVSRVRKCIDAVLGDHKPVTRRDLLPDQLAELCEIDDRHAASV